MRTILRLSCLLAGGSMLAACGIGFGDDGSDGVYPPGWGQGPEDGGADEGPIPVPPGSGGGATGGTAGNTAGATAGTTTGTTAGTTTGTTTGGTTADDPSKMGPKRRPRPVVTRPAPRAPTQLSSSVMLMGDWDIRPDTGVKDPEDGHVLSRCEQMVDVAAALGNDTLNFVPTHAFLAEPLKDAAGNQQKDKYGNPKWRAADYCFKYGNDAVTGAMECRRFDAVADKGDSASRIRDELTACFRRTFEYGMNVSVVPHLDDGREQGVWRNTVAFDPMERIGAKGKKPFSYYDVMLQPVAEAILTAAREARAEKTKIYFALQGEMGATVFYAPAGYVRATEGVRSILAPLRSELGAEVQVGVSLNFNTVTGGQGEAVTDAYKQAVQQLFRDVDFVGVSSYGSVLPRPADEDLDGALSSLGWELSAFDVDLASYARAGLKLHFSELGLGGGDGSGGPAASADIAAARPWAGVFGDYRAEQDPWNPRTRPEFVKLLRRFYRATFDYLSRPHDNAALDGRRWFVDQAFLWNLASWDIQAIYPSSTSREGSYYQADVACLIFQHNTGSAECIEQPKLPWPVGPSLVAFRRAAEAPMALPWQPLR